MNEYEKLSLESQMKIMDAMSENKSLSQKQQEILYFQSRKIDDVLNPKKENDSVACDMSDLDKMDAEEDALEETEEK